MKSGNHDDTDLQREDRGPIRRFLPSLLTKTGRMVLLFFLTAFLVQCASARSTYDLSLWFTDWAPLPLNIAMVAVFFFTFFSLTNSVRIAAALNLILLFLLGLTNWLKSSTLGVPFYPWDLMLVSETANVFEFSLFKGYWFNVLILALPIVPIVWTWRKLPRFKLRPVMRVIVLLGCMGIFSSLLHPSYSALKYFRDRCLLATWSPNESYAKTGVVLAFACHVQNWIVQPPENGYNKSNVLQTLKPFTAPQTSPESAAAVTPDKKINLILVLGEAVWDPTVLKGVKFHSDPVPTLHKMAEQFGHLDLVSPVYGGGTCDAELEVLTGCNMMFFPPGTSPYKYFIRQKLPSIASVLADNGYHTVAIHAVLDSYFNDVQVQPLLGFKQFHPATKWKKYDRQGWYITDSSTIDETIHVADLQGDKPFFISINTMESHWSYAEDRYESRTELAALNAPSLDEDSRAILETYVCTLRRADAAMKKLIDHFKDDPRPTLIVHYGDHLPALGDDYNVYRKCSFWNGEDERANTLALRTTRATFWANFDMKKVPHQTLSTCHMPAYVLNRLQTPLPPFFRFLQDVQKEYPVFSVSGCVDSEGNVTNAKLVAKTELAKKYELLQYDRVFGLQHHLSLYNSKNTEPQLAPTHSTGHRQADRNF